MLGLVLTLVPGVGVTSGGASRWIDLGPFQLQPSELAKFAFMLWGADLLARKEQLGQLSEWRHLLLPLLPGASVICMLVMLGDDLGTTFVLLTIFLALLWVVGTPGRLFIAVLALMGLALIMLIVVAPYRLERLTSFLSPQTNPVGTAMQNIQGKYAVGSGGWFGVGLGAGKEKWGWVPNATTDYIFAIIGEELGLVGTLCVSLLYGGLAYAGLRIARRVDDTFMRLAAAGCHRVDRGPGGGEHRRGDRRVPDHRSTAAARLLRGVLAGDHDGGARHADVVRQTRTRGEGSLGRSGRRRPAKSPKLAGPGRGRA